MDKSEFQVNRKALLELFSHGANLRAFMEEHELIIYSEIESLPEENLIILD
ncbi:MAG: hypothetical protein GX185_06535 [Tissierellia bacterium]|nr:hypothetical protein [Tissierellia bacterium]